MPTRVTVFPWCAAAVVTLCLAGINTASAHALAGQRLFPSTLGFDDPGINAELPLVFSHSRADSLNQNDLDVSVTQPLTPRFSLTAATDYLAATGGGQPSAYGWDNLTVGAVWQAFVVPASESIGSLSIHRTFQHTGSDAVRDDFATWSPEFDFGQGFGGIPENWVRPLAVTGAVAVDLPNNRNEPRTLDWAVSVQYSLPYLQNFVKYVGLGAPFNNLIPLVEFPLQTCLDRGCSGHTTGDADPGLIWIGRYFQVGAELQIPINHDSGSGVGVLVGLDLYLDDLLPHSLGKPIFD